VAELVEGEVRAVQERPADAFPVDAVQDELRAPQRERGEQGGAPPERGRVDALRHLDELQPQAREEGP